MRREKITEKREVVSHGVDPRFDQEYLRLPCH